MGHILLHHQLHPMKYKCAECDVEETKNRTQASKHAKTHGGAAVITIREDADSYQWDCKEGYLRSIPKGQRKPRPEGWMSQTFIKSMRDEVAVTKRVDALVQWDGIDGGEREQREARRNQLLGDNNSWRELTGLRKWQWMKTKAESTGWKPAEQVRKRTRPDTRSKMQCSARCGWHDHSRFTKNACPLHKDYIGHLKPGGKPKGVRGNTREAEEWRSKQRLDAQRRAEAAARPGTFACRRGCGKMMQTKALRVRHEEYECAQDRDGQRRAVHSCATPGCTATHISEAWMRRHEKECFKTFEYESPMCPSCGYKATNQVTRNGRIEVCGRHRYAEAQWERHVTKFKKTRLVRCKWCNEPHLVPGCTATPREMDRVFQCSDNILDDSAGSPQCRARRPRAEPAWMEEWRNEVESVRVADSAYADAMREDGDDDDDNRADARTRQRTTRRISNEADATQASALRPAANPALDVGYWSNRRRAAQQRTNRRPTWTIGSGADAVEVYQDTGELVQQDDVDQTDGPGNCEARITRRRRSGVGVGAAQSTVPPHADLLTRRRRRPDLTEASSPMTTRRPDDQDNVDTTANEGRQINMLRGPPQRGGSDEDNTLEGRINRLRRQSDEEGETHQQPRVGANPIGQQHQHQPPQQQPLQRLPQLIPLPPLQQQHRQTQQRQRRRRPPARDRRRGRRQRRRNARRQRRRGARPPSPQPLTLPPDTLARQVYDYNRTATQLPPPLPQLPQLPPPHLLPQLNTPNRTPVQTLQQLQQRLHQLTGGPAPPQTATAIRHA